MYVGAEIMVCFCNAIEFCKWNTYHSHVPHYMNVMSILETYRFIITFVEISLPFYFLLTSYRYNGRIRTCFKVGPPAADQ